MKYNINNKMILVATLSSFTLSGCIAKNEVKSTPIVYNKFSQKVDSSWGKRENSWRNRPSKSWKSVNKKDDCVNCYATEINPNKRTLQRATTVNSFATNRRVVTYDYSKAPSEQTVNKNYYQYSKLPKNESLYDTTASNTLYYGAYDYTVAPSSVTPKYQNVKMITQPKNRYSSNGSYVSGASIQVGAFRHYSGAKRVAKKYDLLSSKYHVKIATKIQGNRPLHRVRIEGFSSQNEAKKFMERYAINDAFLVRR